MKKYILSIILATLFFITPVYAKEYTVKKLPNGQTLIVKEIHDNPIVIIDTWIKTGSINENAANSGVSHFLEHMFFKGTQKYPTGKFDQILESKGAITNAATSRDYTHYYIEIPSKYFDLAMELHSDMLMNPLLPRNELEMERKVVLEEMAKGNDNPDIILYKKMNVNLYKEHPYKREVIGKENIIETITREEMLNYYNEWYKPDNMITVIVGDVETNKIIKSVEENFKTKSKEKTIKLKHKKDSVKTDIPIAVTNIDTQTGYLLIGFRGVVPKERKESAALDVLTTILGNGQSSRLYRNIQENKQLTNSVSSGHASYRDDSLVFIKAKFNPKNQEKTESEIWSEIDTLKTYPVSEEELEKAKKIIKRDTLYSRESISNIANELGYIAAVTGNVSDYDNYLKEIDKIKAKDLIKVANKYLDKNKASISYIMPLGQNIKPSYEIKHNNIKNENNPKTINFGNKNYPYNSAKLVSSSNNTNKYILENGLTLIINNNKANDIIAMNMLSKGGYIHEKDVKTGTGNLTADLIYKGTKKFTKDEISNLIDSNGIEIFSSLNPDTFSTSIKITKDELPLTLELFDEIINNASLTEDDLNNIREKKLQNIKTSLDIPSSIAFDEMRNLLWEKTPYHHSFKVLEEAYNKVTTDDVKTFYNQIYYPENTIVSVNGNVDEQYLINYFSEVFKNKKAKQYKLTDYTKLMHPMMKDKSSIVQKNSNQSWGVMAYRASSITNTKDWATLKVIDSILGTGMSSRLFYELRDQQGLAYSVASLYQSNVLQGVFLTYIGTNPANTEKALQGMENQIDKLKKEFVSSKELAAAKDRIYGNYLLSLETNSQKAETMSAFELNEKGYDFGNKYFDYINAVTENDIIEAANKYFNKPKIIIVVK